MRDMTSQSDFFVAPDEPPPSRQPPLTTVGPIGWMRANLFSGWVNSLATVVTTGVLAWFLWALMSWSVRNAQWGVVYNNLRLIAVGQYAKTEIWRVQMVAGILIFLLGLSLGIWAHMMRGVFIVVLVALFVILLVPVIGTYIPEPDVYTLIEPRKTPLNFVFVGYKGQEVTFEIDPLDNAEDANTQFVGYQEFKSRESWSTRSRTIRDMVRTIEEAPAKLERLNADLMAATTDEERQEIQDEITATESALRNAERDLPEALSYNLVITLRMRDGSGRPITTKEEGPVEVTFDHENPAGILTFKVRRDGWYALEVVRDDEANGNPGQNQGYAWLRIEGVELFASQEEAVKKREEEFGPPPKMDPVLYGEEGAYRFEGARTFGEFISVQVSPFFSYIQVPCIVAAVLFFNGWVIGTLGKHERNVRRFTLAGWIVSMPVILVLLSGFSGSRTMPLVSTSEWQGLLLTILLTFVGITASFPLGVALALGRRSDLPAIKWTCTLYIETVRGVPLITILFMAKWIVPFFWSALADLDLPIRMMLGLTLFSAAYLAENVRGGLQIVPYGQIEAARALGMNPLLTTIFIVLPQALRAVIPAIVGQFISLFKDTSLVALVGVFELAGIVDLIIDGNPTLYRPYQREAFIFIAIIYFIISYAMSDVSRRLEASGAGSIRQTA